MYVTKLHESHTGRLRVRRKVTDKILDHFCDTFALECPSIRDCGEDQNLKMLRSDMTRIVINNDFMAQVTDLR